MDYQVKELINQDGRNYGWIFIVPVKEGYNGILRAVAEHFNVTENDAWKMIDYQDVWNQIRYDYS